jgi:N-sulfoglucosamine sulfohydrolase
LFFDKAIRETLRLNPQRYWGLHRSNHFFLFLSMHNFPLILLLVLALIASSGASSAQQQKRLNVLLVMADDWSYGHAGFYGDKVVKTPNMDAVAKAGAVFLNAFCTAPSCTPSRASLLTGKYPHELEAGVSLWGYLPSKFKNYSVMLEQAGYFVGMTGKGWGPGSFEAGGYQQNPAGKPYKDFATFLSARPPDKPFSFWFGSYNPHRPYEEGSGSASGMDAERVKVPGWLPDVPVIRNDILDYYLEVERFDQQLGEILGVLKESGEIDNTLIIITGDNGMPFPRAKATLYDAGAKIPLVMSLKGVIPQGIQIDEFVTLADLAPTILEIAPQESPKEMTGVSLYPLLRQEKVKNREVVFLERERHANVRNPELGYPSRAVRTKNYLYIRNYEPDRWPAGDPQLYHSVGPFGDVDDSPSKRYLIDKRESAAVEPFFRRAFSKRPSEELYDLDADPDQLENVASQKKYSKALTRLRKQLHDWQRDTADPRATDPHYVVFDSNPYFGPPVKGAPSTYSPKGQK